MLQIQRKRQHGPDEQSPESSLVKSESSKLPLPGELDAEPSPSSKKKAKKNKKQEQKLEGKFEPFDYSQVDFNRFKGGSNQNTNQKNGAKSKAKNKVMYKPLRTSFTFPTKALSH